MRSEDVVARATVVIPNWNGRVHLGECLESLRSQSMRDFEIYVVDNGSTDDSVAFIRHSFPEVRVMEMPVNGGFAYAVNAGIRQACSEYVVLLNNDTRADSNWLQSLIKALDEHPDYDFAASLMLLYERPEVVNAAGDIYSLPDMDGKNRGIWEDASKYRRKERVLGACAGAAIYRLELFDSVGLFDESFFLMCEDTDLNLRALRLGKKCLYVPDARVWHKLHATLNTQPAVEMERLAIRNMAMCAAKNLPLPLLTVALLRNYYKPWRLFRSVLPLRPSLWRKVPTLSQAQAGRLGPVTEGLRMGLSKRTRRTARSWDLYRWLREGVGPV